MMAAGTSLVSVAMMTLLINSRHLMYGLSYPIERVHGSLAKFYTVYTLIDEAFALNSGPERHTLRGSRILWIHAGNAYERYPQFHTRVLLGVEFSGTS